MNRKIIIIITVLICLCAALITAQHFMNRETETTTAPVALTEAPQTAVPTESATKERATAESTPVQTEAPTGDEQTEKPSERPTESVSNNDPTQPQTVSSDKKAPGTNTTEAEKTGNTQTTSKPNNADQESTSGSVSAPQKPETESSSESTSAPQKTDKETTSQTTTKPQSTTTTEAEKQTVTVTISINCEKALDYGKDVPENGYFLVPCKYTAEQGATIFDILEAVAKENGITLKYQSKAYIQAINGLAEKDCGGASGWTYIVNGAKPNKSSAKYEVADGDIIEWYYVTSPAD